MFDDSEGEILNPIPGNITDLARMAVMKQHHGKPQVNHTPAQAGMKDPNATAKAAFGIKSEANESSESDGANDVRIDGGASETQTNTAPLTNSLVLNPNNPQVPLTQQVPVDALMARTPSEAPKTTFFKDGAGNEFKMEGNKLFCKSWHELTEKFRIINEKSGKELSLEGKKVQVYGWVEVKRDDSNGES